MNPPCQEEGSHKKVVLIVKCGTEMCNLDTEIIWMCILAGQSVFDPWKLYHSHHFPAKQVVQNKEFHGMEEEPESEGVCCICIENRPCHFIAFCRGTCLKKKKKK